MCLGGAWGKEREREGWSVCGDELVREVGHDADLFEAGQIADEAPHAEVTLEPELIVQEDAE